MTIEIDVKAPYRTLVDTDFLQQAAQCVLTAERAQGDVTLVLTDDDTVAQLNQQFLGKTGPTDVLSFPAMADDEPFVLPPEAAIYLGDVIIAMPFTQQQAQRLQRPLMHELALLTIHGLLHLLGYDHATPDEKAIMWAKQDAVLSGLGIGPMDV
jgi:probable rRNA maturation factor